MFLLSQITSPTYSLRLFPNTINTHPEPMWAFAILALILPATISIPAGNSGPSQHNATNEPSLPKAIRGVRKMSPDEGEKFFWNYWYFAEPELGNITSHDDASSSIIQRSYPLRPALSVSPSAQSGNWDDGILPRDLLFPRDFKCPAGTEGCASINRPNRCCTAGDTCKLVQDTGSGDVGCCPRGEACSNEIGLCPRDYSTCSQELGGGCCIPGYGCVQGGCEYLTSLSNVYPGR